MTSGCRAHDSCVQAACVADHKQEQPVVHSANKSATFQAFPRFFAIVHHTLSASTVHLLSLPVSRPLFPLLPSLAPLFALHSLPGSATTSAPLNLHP